MPRKPKDVVTNPAQEVVAIATNQTKKPRSNRSGKTQVAKGKAAAESQRNNQKVAAKPNDGALQPEREEIRASPVQGEAESPKPPSIGLQNEVAAAFSRISRRFENSHISENISTGFTALDSAVGYLQRGQLVTLASRSKLGKSFFALNLIWNIAGLARHPVLVFDFQEGKDGWVERLLSHLSMTDRHKRRKGPISHTDFHRLTDAANQIYMAPIFLNENRDILPPEMRKQVLTAIQEHGQMGLIVVDFLEALRWPNPLMTLKEERNCIISSLKSLARETNTPVLVLSDVEDEGAESGRVKLETVGNGSRLHMESDVCMILHEHRKSHPTGVLRKEEVVVPLEIAKHRNAPLSSLSYAFRGCFGTFTELPTG